MKFALLGALALAGVGLSAPALAQSVQYVAKGYCQLTSIGSATALSSCSGGIPSFSKSIEICVEAQSIRYRDDGTAPTTTVGMLIPSGSCFPYQGTLTAIQFIAVNAGAIVNVSFYAGPQ